MKVKNDRQISVNILFSLDKISGFEFRDYDLGSLCRLKKSKCSDYIRFRHGIKLTQWKGSSACKISFSIMMRGFTQKILY